MFYASSSLFPESFNDFHQWKWSQWSLKLLTSGLTPSKRVLEDLISSENHQNHQIHGQISILKFSSSNLHRLKPPSLTISIDHPHWPLPLTTKTTHSMCEKGFQCFKTIFINYFSSIIETTRLTRVKGFWCFKNTE